MMTDHPRLGPAARSRAVRLAAVVVAAAIAVVGLPPPAAAAEQVNGSGSTWSAIAVEQWAADVARQGISINYNPAGSSTGRKFYIEKQSDFAVSEIPFQAETRDREGQVQYDEIKRANQERPFTYLPIVAGGTAFMYHLKVNGQQIRDLRLSGATIAKIFTGVIRNWNDPAIAADDGRQFPDKQMKPIVRSDGSGTSAQFSAYMANQHRDIWGAFCAKARLSPCGQTSSYPYFDGSQAQRGSDGVAGAVASSYNDGAITYVEYGYAKQRNFPVVAVKNRAGFAVEPTAGNVAVALTRARLNPDSTQVLDDVYTNPDPAAYPVSSYSYMIAPTTTAAPFTPGKGAALGQFILYFLCTGQQKAAQLGYSPLPPNLVEFGFAAVRRIPGAPPPPALSACANPTISGEFSPNKVERPPASARADAPRAPLGSSGGGGGGGTGVAGGRVGGGGAAPGAAGSTDAGAAAGTGTGSGTTSPTDPGAAGVAATDPTAAATDPGAAEALSGEALASEQAAGGAGGAALAAASVRAKDDPVPLPVYAAVAVVVLLAVFGPPALSLALRRRARTSGP